MSRLISVVLVAAGVTVLPQSSAHAVSFTGKVKIAAIQTSPVFREKATNLADMQDRARAAAADGADLIVFPELALTGYKYRTIAEMAPDAEPVPGPSTAAMAAVAKQTKSYIVFGMVEQDAGKFYDTVVLVGPEGYVGKYAKITMGHHSEAVLFTRGAVAPPVFETSIGRIGLASCYDGAFPENARLMGLAGAQIMVLSDTENGTTWRDYVRTRAVENNAFAVVSNRVGSERNSTFNGYSLIADPEYNLLANASTDQVETISATVDLGETSTKLVSERRPELYRALTKALPSTVLGVSSEPQSSVAGTATGVDVLVATTGIAAGTPITAAVTTQAGTTIAKDTGSLGVDQARLSLTIPSDAAVGTHSLTITSAGSAKTLPFTVKDVAKPGTFGTMPAEDASASSSIYIGLDTPVTASASVPLTLTGGGSTVSLTGKVNTTVVDDRVVAPYSGLAPDTNYRVTLPEGAVEDAVTGAGNDVFSFSFTTAPVARTAVSAVAQIATTPLDKTANTASILAQMQAAKTAGVAFVVFPELTVTGPAIASRDEATAVAEPIDGASVRAIATRADELDLTVTFGLVESANGKLYDTQVLVGPDGKTIGSHRNTHLDDDQVGIFDAGNTVSAVYDTEAGPVGLVTGHEAYFPEVIRSLSIRGALVLSVGVSDEGQTWRELVRTRGSENKVYVLGANQSTDGGQSLIARTSRAVNAQLDHDDAGLAKATLNLTTIANRYYTYVDASTAKARTTHYYLDRRPEIYAPISMRSASTVWLSVDKTRLIHGKAPLTATVDVAGTEDARSGGTVELRSGTDLLATGTLREGRATFTVPSTRLPAGRPTLTATYVGNDDLIASSARTSLSVSKAPASVSLKVKKKVKAGGRPTLTVKVNASGLTPTGIVTVKVGKKTFTQRLSKGTARLKLPKLKAAKTTVKVTYTGSGHVAKVTKSVTIRTTR